VPGGRAPALAGRGPPRAGGPRRGHALAPPRRVVRPRRRLPRTTSHRDAEGTTAKGRARNGGQRKRRREWERERERGYVGAVGEDVGGLGGRDGSLGGMTRGTRVGPANRRRRLGRALALGFGEGAPALGGPHWAAQARRRRGRGLRREVGRGEEGRVALGHTIARPAQDEGGGVEREGAWVIVPCWALRRGGGMALFLFSSFYSLLLFLFRFVHKKSYKFNGYIPRQYIKPKIRASSMMQQPLFP
jgi:hypothetical protein